MSNIISVIIWSIIGYIIGSVPWALIIGKVFYKKDIRQYGSGNLGGTNAGRVLGKKAGIAVTLLDGLKAFILMLILAFVDHDVIPYVGIAVMIGHCFPLFANFKGGKGVACAMGYLFGLGVFGFADFIFIFVYPTLIFFLSLAITKIVSLSSMIDLTSATIISYLTTRELYITILIGIMTLFVIYRHKENIKRIIKGKESKITWIK